MQSFNEEWQLACAMETNKNECRRQLIGMIADTHRIYIYLELNNYRFMLKISSLRQIFMCTKIITDLDRNTRGCK